MPAPPLEEGQLWEMKDSTLLISTVGKRLVHYKHFSQGSKRAKISLVSKTALQTYLEDQKAILIQQANPVVSRPSAAA